MNMATPDNETPRTLGSRIRKRLIVCCDGTWQSSVDIKKNVPSNVTRLARSFAREGFEKDDKDTVWQQVVYYDAGIGTGEISDEEKKRQGGYAHGFLSNIVEAYNFLVLNWCPGDKVYCFGFSRGAYTARAVAGLVNDIGIIPPRDMQDFAELFAAYQVYDGKDPHGFRKSAAYRNWQEGIRSAEKRNSTTGLKLWDKMPHARVPESSRIVEVVGVFDTVGSLGVPESDFLAVKATMGAMNLWWGGVKPGFHNVNLSPYIRNAFHAIALDEHRRPFSPTLWHYPEEPKFSDNALDIETLRDNFKLMHHEDRPGSFTSDKDRKDYEDKVDAAWAAIIDYEMREQWETLGRKMPDLKQVWFPGFHINIGGGSDDILDERLGDFEQVALISFAWMVEQVKPFLQFEPRLGKRSVRDRMALVIPFLAEVAAKQWKDYGTWDKPLWKGLETVGLYSAGLKDLDSRAVIGWAEGPMPDSYTPEMKATGEKVRTPGDYRYAVDDKERKTLLGETREFIHPSIQFRKLMVEGYDPKALKDYKRIWNKSESKWYWSKPAEKQPVWFWQTKKPEIEPIEVPEWPLTGDVKFSRFLTMDYTNFLDDLEKDEEDHILQSKSAKSGEDQSKKLTPNTDATEFFDKTAQGVEWKRPVQEAAKNK